ncbi:MAG: YbjN domain-containing protein [Bacteroidetes bacterium]|nr:YbjN domain-containing protein [Bacteroidota bacterium]
MEHINHYTNLVEEVIRDLGVDPATARGEKPGTWNMRLGSANVWIDVWQSKDKDGNPVDGGYMQIMAPICEVPVENQAAFTKELLEINHTLYGVGFTIFEKWAYIKAIRELEGLDKSEVRATFDRIGIYADDYDDVLKAKYWPAQGGRG